MMVSDLITLESPFPADQADVLYGWLAASGTVSSAECFPSTPETAAKMLADPRVRTWAVRTSDGGLVGAVMFEPLGTMGGRSYAVADRSIWGLELIDDAARLGIEECFATCPDLDWILGNVVETNWPARHLNERIGMKLKNVIPECVMQRGKERALLVYEMSRERWQEFRKA